MKHNALQHVPNSVLQSMMSRNSAIIHEFHKQAGYHRDKALFYKGQGERSFASHETGLAIAAERHLNTSHTLQRALKLQFKANVLRGRAERRLIACGKPVGFGYNLTSFELSALADMYEKQAKTETATAA